MVGSADGGRRGLLEVQLANLLEAEGPDPLEAAQTRKATMPSATQPSDRSMGRIPGLTSLSGKIRTCRNVIPAVPHEYRSGS
jgi:hypothetical protein